MLEDNQVYNVLGAKEKKEKKEIIISHSLCSQDNAIILMV